MPNPLGPDALDQLFRKARTFNGYDETPVTRDDMDAIWELMKFGPTSANCLPARILWCESTESKQRLAALALPSNSEKILKAPVTAIIGMDIHFFEELPKLFPHADARSWFAGNDALIPHPAQLNGTWPRHSAPT